MKTVKSIVDRLKGIEGRLSIAENFTDFFEMAAIFLNNSGVTSGSSFAIREDIKFDERERKFKEIANKHTEEEIKTFDSMLRDYLEIAADNMQKGKIKDLTSEMYHYFKQNSSALGQFFSSAAVSTRDAAGIQKEELLKAYEEKGYVVFNDPACGAGALILGIVDKAIKVGIPKKNIYVVASDINKTCICMAYTQFSAYGIKAVLIHGDALGYEELERWTTPAFRS